MKKTDGLSEAQDTALLFFSQHVGRWLTGTDLHDEAWHIRMNTVNSLVKMGLVTYQEGRGFTHFTTTQPQENCGE